MNYFNPKEDVIDLKLTQYGKHLLSKGRLNPKYYAFFDDDIIYDVRWAAESLAENQSDVDMRVQDETPRPRTQTCYYGVEEEIKKVNELVRLKKSELGDDRLQPTATRHYTLSQPLGTTTLHTNKLPGWEAHFLLNKISGSIDFITGSSQNAKIPQLNCEIKYKVAPYAEGEEPEIDLDNPDGADADFEGVWGGMLEFDDGTTLFLEKDSILIEIDESNTDYLDSNFDIEVYEVKTVAATDDAQQAGEGAGEKEELVPLYFARLQSDLGINYSTPAPEGSSQAISTVFPDVDPSYVEYFFDVNVDREIDIYTICKNLPNNKTRRGRLQSEFRCPEEDISSRALTDFAEGLYESEMGDMNDFEECD